MRTMIVNTLMRSIVLVGVVIWGTACEKNDFPSGNLLNGPGPFFMENYICGYIDTPTQDMMKISNTPSSETSYKKVGWTLMLNEWTSNTCTKVQGSYKGNPAKFDSLAKAHNDLEYKRETNDYFGNCLYRRTESLHVVSDADYDALHPAGTLLDDILTVDFESAEEYLRSGYKAYDNFLGKSTKFGVDLYDSPNGKTALRESLTEFNQIKRKLIKFYFSFSPTKAPDMTSTHRFTVTYTNEDGVVLTATTTTITVSP